MFCSQSFYDCFDNTIVSDNGYAIIFNDNSFLFLCELYESDITIGLSALNNEDIKTIKQNKVQDLLNRKEVVYAPTRKYSKELKFEYARIKNINIERIDRPISKWNNGNIEDIMIPGAFGSITFNLKNDNRLLFSPEGADFDGYMDLRAFGMIRKDIELPFSQDEYERIFNNK